MQGLLPDLTQIRVAQHLGTTRVRSLARVDHLLLILPERPPQALWQKLPGGGKLKALFGKRATAAVPALQTRLANERQTLVAAATLTTTASTFDKLTVARKLVASALSGKSGALGILIAGFEPDQQWELQQIAVAAALAAGFPLPSFKRRPAQPPIKSIALFGLEHRVDLSRVIAEAKGNNLARWLTALPPNKLDAANYAALLKRLAADYGWRYKRYDTRELEKLGAGAFLAVAQGNDDDSGAIVRLQYRPGARSASADLCLVGKGIIFDTGGTNLKPFASMLEMHGDMQGSAVAVGTMVAISELELPIAVDCWLAITENRLGPRAYKSQDLITAANGMTIQAIHTDAEGRMALADTLVLASRSKPKLIVDFATLTGACINAITKRYSGIFSNRSDWHPRLKRTGRLCGERVWPFPIGKEFLGELESEVADIKQCSASGQGDHILAASFLAEFVENDVPWIHIDLSASTHKNGLGHVPTEVTGFGVRYTMSLVLDDQLLQAI